MGGQIGGAVQGLGNVRDPGGGLVNSGALGGDVKKFANSSVFDAFDPLDFSGRKKARKDQQLRDIINDRSAIPELFRITDQDGNLQDRFSNRAQARNAFGAEQLRNLATGSGLTAESQAALNIQRQQGQRALSNLAARGQSNLRSSLAGLASRGGLRGGTRERLAGGNQLAQLQLGQNQRFKNQANELGLRQSDATLRRQTLQSLNTQDRQAIANDLQNTISDNRKANDALRLEEANRREALLNLENRPKGGLAGGLGNILGGITG